MHVPLYLCLFMAPFAHAYSKLHLLMTVAEVLEVFHTTVDKIPEYDLVPVQYSINCSQKHKTAKIRVTAFDQDYELRLHSTGGYLASTDTPVWTVTSNREAPDNLQYNLIPKALENMGIPMHDDTLEAALLVSRQQNKPHTFDGLLPSDIVIRPLPERITRDVLYCKNGLYKNHSLSETPTGEYTHSQHHIIYKSATKEEYKNSSITNPLTRMYNIPDKIYPEVLVVLDHELYKTLGENIKEAIRYVLGFWNGVDLRYRSLTNPAIRLNIAGIIIAMDEGAIPYIQENIRDKNMVNADKALHDMGSYFYEEKRFPWKIYDMAMCHTKLNLCNMVDDTYCNPATLGYAYVAGACNRNSTTKFSGAVGVVEDDGGFSGVIPTAHELGHLLGAHHDGVAGDTKNCSANNGDIMGGTLHLSVNEFSWSNCSINAFHKFLCEDRAKCLYDAPPRATAIRRILPGKLMSPDEQCKQSYGGESCNKNSSSMCYELKCIVPGTNGLCMPISAAADGSSCGRDLLCLDGECVLQGSEIKKERNPA